jgi:hypothetical protein
MINCLKHWTAKVTQFTRDSSHPVVTPDAQQSISSGQRQQLLLTATGLGELLHCITQRLNNCGCAIRWRCLPYAAGCVQHTDTVTYNSG